MSIYGSIYEIVNKVNGKVYIGQTTKNIRARWSAHKSEAKFTKRPGKLHAAIRKYGHENFTIEMLTTASSKDELDLLEQIYIDGLGGLGTNGYNLKDGGAHGKYSKESREKMSKSLKGKPAWNKGQKCKPMSDEQKKLVSLNFKGKPSKRRKQVIDMFGNVFPHAGDAALMYGVSRNSVNDVCLGKVRAVFGLTFSYHYPST